MFNLLEVLKELSEKIKDFKDAIQNESQTRTVLIEPFIKLLGYDTTNPFEVIPEYTCDVGTKKGEKVDYALMKGNDIVMVIEAKDSKVKLNEKNISQLYRYYSVSSAKVALLTNGVEYMFFTDTVKQNVMDYEPFFKFSMLDLKDTDSDIIELFTKDNLKPEKIREYAIKSSFSTAFLDYFIQQAKSPTNDFVTFIIKNIGVANLNSSDARNLVSKELTKLIQNNITNIQLEDKQQNTPEDTEQKRKRLGRDNKDKIIGVVMLSELTLKNITGTRPVNVTFVNKTYNVKSWADVLEVAFLYAISRGFNKDLLLTLDGYKESNEGWVRNTEEGLRNPRKIGGVSVYIDTHGSSYQTLSKLKNVTEALHIVQDDIMLELQ